MIKKKILLMAAAAMMAASTVFAAGDETNGHAYFTKFLISRDGQVLKRYEPTAKMEDLEADLRALSK